MNYRNYILLLVKYVTEPEKNIISYQSLYLRSLVENAAYMMKCWLGYYDKLLSYYTLKFKILGIDKTDFLRAW